MEEINLDFQKDNHRNLNMNSNLNSRVSNINIMRDMDESANLGVELLMNKTKASPSSDSNKVEEFRPSDPVVFSESKPRTPSPSISVTMDNHLSSSNSLDNTIDLNDIGISLDNNNSNEIKIDDLNLGSSNSFSNNNSSNNSRNNVTENITSIDLNNDNDLNLNLDSILNDDNNSSSNNDNSSSNNIFSQPEYHYEKPKTYEELQKEKAEYIRLLDRLEQKGIHAHKKFTMESDYNEVKSEVERLTRQRECDQSVKFQRKMMVAFITAVEFLNNKFDPLDLKLNGWSESIHENITDYDDVFEELHEKYKGKGEMAPELKLMLMVGGSGFMFHLTNTMFKTSLPGMNDIMRQNPDLMKQFASAAASSVGQQNPGFSNLMGGMFGGGGGGQQSASRQPPPPRKEMNGPPDINDILNNMSNSPRRTNIDMDLNSNFSESDAEAIKHLDIKTGSNNKRSVNLDI
jgi:hypothetical protein